MRFEHIKIEKLVFGGQGLAYLPDGRVVFVWNALPDEIVDIEIIKKKKDYLEAIATNIITPSPERIAPKDDHFLATSPWQIMSYENENKWKHDIAIETYKKIGGDVFDDIDPEIIFPDEQYHYRNKMEFCFVPADERDIAIPPPHRGTSPEDILIAHHISLAFFNRGGKSRFPLKKSELASPFLNETALYILKWINEKNIPMRSLKSLIVRTNQAGEAIAALFIKDELTFDDFPKRTDTLKGFQLYYSTHKSPASVPTKLLYNVGQDYLTETLDHTTLKFGLLSFFQVHIPVFTKALHDIAQHVPAHTNLIDFYSGVGSIGLLLAKNQTQVTLVDNNAEAIGYAQENINSNNINNAEAHCIPAEKITSIITNNKMIILDPPRAGLHEDVTHTLLKTLPPKIIYLSCNLSTQARDIARLAQKYKITFSRLYNFFPRTPHIEGLIILEKK